MFKVNNRNTRKRCDICSKLIIKTPQRRQWHGSGVFIVNSEHISNVDLLTYISIVDFDQVNVSWEKLEISLPHCQDKHIVINGLVVVLNLLEYLKYNNELYRDITIEPNNISQYLLGSCEQSSRKDFLQKY